MQKITHEILNLIKKTFCFSSGDVKSSGQKEGSNPHKNYQITKLSQFS